MLPRLGLHSRRTPIGIDLGSTGVRAVQLQALDNAWEVIRVARSELSQPGDPRAAVDRNELAQRLKQCITGETFKGRSIATAVQSPEVEFHPLELPVAVVGPNSQEARDIVRWELSRLMKEAPEKVEVDYWMLPSAQSSGPNAIGVGARRQPIIDLLGICRGVGLNCVCVDATATALHRFGLHLRTWKPRDVWGVLDLGYRRSRLILSVGATPVLTRDVGSGGHAWTNQIAEALQVSVKTAEVQKREHGIALTGRGIRPDSDQPPATELAGIIFTALRGHLSELAGEIKRSYEYILSRYGVGEAGDLVLVGGGACLERFPDYLAQSLGISVKTVGEYLGQPGCAIRFASAQGHRLERLAVAIGMSLEEREQTHAL